MEKFSPIIIYCIGCIVAVVGSYFSVRNQLSNCATKSELALTKELIKEDIKKEYVTQQHFADNLLTVDAKLNAIVGKIDGLVKGLLKQDERLEKLYDIL